MSDNSDIASRAGDPWNLEDLRMTQQFGEALKVTKPLITVPVRKPGSQDFFQVSREEKNRLTTATLVLKEEQEEYLVHPSLWPALADEIGPRRIVLAVTRQSVVFLWSQRLPGVDGKQDNWMTSALDAADRATKRWVRIKANMNLGAYDVFEAQDDLGEPKWPAESFEQILRIAFRDRFIQSLDHPALKRLRGEL